MYDVDCTDAKSGAITPVRTLTCMLYKTQTELWSQNQIWGSGRRLPTILGWILHVWTKLQNVCFGPNPLHGDCLTLYMVLTSVLASLFLTADQLRVPKCSTTTKENIGIYKITFI